MTLEELKANYTVAYKIIMRERARRNKEYVDNSQTREEQVGEMEKLLVILDDMKDELKKYIGSAPEQPTLLDVVKEVKYT